MWNKDKIQNLLRTSDKTVERAVVAIYDRQTQDEKNTEATRHDNTVGFTGAHAALGSYYARWVLGGRHLNGRHLDKARAMMMHYHRQLAEIANANSKAPEFAKQVRDIRHHGQLKAPVAIFEMKVREYMEKTGQPRAAAESVVRNVMAGKCPDGCCGGDEEAPACAGCGQKFDCICAAEQARDDYKNALEDHNADDPRQPPPGSWAEVSRMMVQLGVMDGDTADRWKDEMKDLEMQSEMD